MSHVLGAMVVMHGSMDVLRARCRKYWVLWLRCPYILMCFKSNNSITTTTIFDLLKNIFKKVDFPLLFKLED